MIGGFHWFGGMNWIGMIVGSLVSVALLIGLIVLVVWAVRRVSRPQIDGPAPTTGGQAARDIVQARYARGEINREEFLRMMEDLSK